MHEDIPYPKTRKECMCLLEMLGFEQARRVGKGGHQYKYKHPWRKMDCQHEKPFVIVPYKFFNLLGEKVCKKLICYGFSWKEIKEACKNL